MFNQPTFIYRSLSVCEGCYLFITRICVDSLETENPGSCDKPMPKFYREPFACQSGYV